MKNLFLFLAILSMPITSVFAYGRGCFNDREIGYKAGELARESRQLANVGHGRFGTRFADEARRLARTSRMLAQTSENGAPCFRLQNIFENQIVPAFRDLQQEARGPRRPDVNDDLRDIRRAFQDLEREVYDDGRNGRGGRHGRGYRGPFGGLGGAIGGVIDHFRNR